MSKAMKDQQAKQQAAAAQENVPQEPQEPTQQENSPEETSQQESIQDESKYEQEESSDDDDDEELYRMMIGKKVNDSGAVIYKKTGAAIGRLVEGKLRKVIGRKVGERGAIVNSKGKFLGRVEPVDEESSSEEESDSDEEGNTEEENVTDERVSDQEEVPHAPKSESTRKVSNTTESETEDVNDETEDTVKETKDKIDSATEDTNKNIKDTADKSNDVKDTALAGGAAGTLSSKLNDSPIVKKSGKVFDADNNLVSHADKCLASKLAGYKVDSEGNVYDEEGEIAGTADMIKSKEENKPFNPNEAVNEDSPEVRKSGKVLDMDDNLVGHVDKRIASKYAGCKVDSEGNVIDKDGKIVGKAEMIKKKEESESFNPNKTVDKDSPEVRKSGKIFDMDDNLVGHVDKRIGSKYAGCKVNPEGNVIDKDGHIVGRGEMIKEENKPFNPNQMVDEDSPEVRKSGKVFDMDDNLVGHVDKRIASKYAGCKVDSEGNVINKDGDTVGKAEIIKEESESEEEEDKACNPNLMVGEHSPEVRRSGKVVDEDDEIVGTVDKGSANQWAGFKVDSYGNVINHNGHTVGKADMIKELTDEERQQQEEEKQYRSIADSMSQAVQQSLDKIKPVLKQITDNIEAEEAKSEKDRDEKKLVETVKPLIEQGSNILGEANGAIRGLDPSGKIAKQAQARTSERKALPEEYHLAELLSQLTGEVSTTIDKAKKKIKNMPHAKRELGPLWNILQSPLLQILSAVGLLLTGVLGLVGNILNGLGLGSIINSLLGGLGLNKILEGFGLGDALNLSRK